MLRPLEHKFELFGIFKKKTLEKNFIHIIGVVFYRKEVKDPDVLYNMLKNLLAQIKVRLSLSLSEDLLTPTPNREASEGLTRTLCRLILTPGPSWNL